MFIRILVLAVWAEMQKIKYILLKLKCYGMVEKIRKINTENLSVNRTNKRGDYEIYDTINEIFETGTDISILFCVFLFFICLMVMNLGQQLKVFSHQRSCYSFPRC